MRAMNSGMIDPATLFAADPGSVSRFDTSLCELSGIRNRDINRQLTGLWDMAVMNEEMGSLRDTLVAFIKFLFRIKEVPAPPPRKRLE
jgi:hypothetical protein